MNGLRPGEDLRRLSRLIREGVAKTQLDLSDLSVLTEAASGAYIVTPVIAALAGAEVVAVTSDSRFGSAQSIKEATLRLAEMVGVADRIHVTPEKSSDLFAAADVVTNSGHVRPIIGPFARAIRKDAVVALMFEKWEMQAGRVDIDLPAMIARGVEFAGTNERHPEVDVFSYLGLMAVAQLADAGVSAYRGRVALYCKNPFLSYLMQGLSSAGAIVSENVAPGDLLRGPQQDAIILATTPGEGPALSGQNLECVGSVWPDTVVCQFWGDLDRQACEWSGVNVWPVQDPGRGHMGVLPSRLGPEPVVRLQTGGFKVGQVLKIPSSRRTASDLAWLDV